MIIFEVTVILEVADALDIAVKSVRYTRGSFIFPGAQSFPHCSFSQRRFLFLTAISTTLPLYLSPQSMVAIKAWPKFSCIIISPYSTIDRYMTKHTHTQLISYQPC